MLNTERNGASNTNTTNNNGVANVPIKKTALRDVQNETVGLNGETVKVCGTKRLTPERPSSSQALPSSVALSNGTKENLMNVRRRFELELGTGRVLGQKVTTPMRDTNWHQVPVIPSSSNVTPIMSFSSTGPSVPGSNSKPNNTRTPSAAKVNNEQIRTERFICLQKFLKQCDDADQKAYMQKLLRLPPDELSNHAYALEKRAIQLTIEEGQEMKRMKALNILAKSSPVNKSLQSTPSLQPNKR